MQNTVQKPDTIRLWSGVLKINWVNIWAIKKAWLDVSYKIAQLKFANAQLPPRKKVDKVVFKTEIVELFLDTIQTIFGWDMTTVAWVATPITNEAKWTGWVIWKPIKLSNKNGANTSVASIVIKANWTALVLNTNYAVYVWDGANWEFGYTYITPMTANALVITADYSYTPYASKKLTYDDVIDVLTLNPVTFENTNSDWKKFSLNILQWVATSWLAFDFANDDDLENFASIPVEFEWYPTSENKLFEIYDEQGII